MPLDPRLAPMLELLSAEEVLLTGTAQERRDDLDRRRAARGILPAGPDPALHSVTDVYAGSVLIRVYRPREGRLPGLIHLHGGGWWLGSVADGDLGCSRRALAADCVVLSVEYRLAPENPYPAGLDDCWEATRWVAAHAEELGLSSIALGGGSAGANLAAAVALRAREAGGPALAGLLLEFPGMNLAFDDESYDLYGDGYGFTKQGLRECAEFYGGDPLDPFVSPVRADLHDLPPTLVTTAEYDAVRDGGELFAKRMADVGGDVTLERFDGIGHGCGELDLLPDVTARYRALVHTFLGRVLS